jgi:hypothetical protein
MTDPRLNAIAGAVNTQCARDEREAKKLKDESVYLLSIDVKTTQGTLAKKDYQRLSKELEIAVDNEGALRIRINDEVKKEQPNSHQVDAMLREFTSFSRTSNARLERLKALLGVLNEEVSTACARS